MGWAARAQTTDSLQLKYDTYRTRLKRDFVRVGNGPGKSIAMAGRAYTADGRSMIYYGDNTTYHGWYLATLGTEYALLKRDRKPTAETAAELYYAIKAIDRLDSLAETLYYDSLGRRGTASINGFFVRDDIDSSFLLEFPDDDLIFSDYMLGKSFPKDDAKYERDNEMSQDQAIHLLFGLTLITHYVDSAAEFQGVRLQAYARETGLRIIRYIARDDWTILNPVTGEPVYRGPNAKVFSYGFVKTAKKLNGGKLPKDFPKPKRYSAPAFALTSTGLVPVFFNRAMIMILATTGNAWGPKCVTNRFLAAQDYMWHKQIYPLVHAELYGVKHTLSPKLGRRAIKKLLDTADPKRQGSYGPWGWNTSNRWLASRYKFKTYDGFFKKRDNTGLDFMILHNMYRLRFGL